jgi:hypothetical protein
MLYISLTCSSTSAFIAGVRTYAEHDKLRIEATMEPVVLLTIIYSQWCIQLLTVPGRNVSGVIYFMTTNCRASHAHKLGVSKHTPLMYQGCHIL